MTETLIDFKPITAADRKLYNEFMPDGYRRGCELSFANLVLWGDQRAALIGDNIVIFSRFGRYTTYPFPLGKADKREAIEAIIKDSKKRGVPCRISSLDEDGCEIISRLYPDEFEFTTSEGSYDYVYSIEDLATLAGKKYHSKKNHLNRFIAEHPNYKVETISCDNITRVKNFVDDWFSQRTEIDPEEDYTMEIEAMERAFESYHEIGMDGIVITDGEEIVAMTMGAPMTSDVFDVNFEKARGDVRGAYTVVYYEFARYIRNKYPDIRYLDREEDMGIEGLRQAKKSYHPVYRVKKYKATLLEK